MARILRLLMIGLCLALLGCSDALTSIPSSTASAPAPPIRREAPTAAASAPTAAPGPAATLTARPQPAPTATPLPTAAPTVLPSATPAPTLMPAFSYPIGRPGQPPGEGFFIRHGYATENTWYNPGWWHTGEDWYAIEGDTAGAQVYAIADGQVVYAGANYPGRVVIVQHAADLFSMYGHLDPRLAVQVGQRVARGDLIGTVLRRSDRVPNHLHFEVRTFLTSGSVNGDAPRYGYRCGVRCPPGPGYWPIDAPEHPSQLGWRNPTHVINRRMFAPGASEAVIAAARPASDTLMLWSLPPDVPGRQPVGELKPQPGERYPLLGVWAGPEAMEETSAQGYRLWYRIQTSDGQEGWVQAAVPSAFETGGDGRPSSIYFNFFPAIEVEPTSAGHND